MEEILHLTKQFLKSTDEAEQSAILLKIKSLDTGIKQKAILVNQVKKALKNIR